MLKSFRWITDLVFPPRCPFCDRAMEGGRACCPDCAQELTDQTGLRELAYGLVCASSYLYRGNPREGVLRFKFQRRRGYALPFAIKGAETIRDCFSGIAFDVVTAVPLSRKRKKERGYNQSELFARPAAKLCGLPYEELLKKTKDNRIQHSLSRNERALNVQGVYGAGKNIAGRTILLCDDIVTSGATLGECGKILLENGAKKVYCLTIAAVNLKESGCICQGNPL